MMMILMIIVIMYMNHAQRLSFVNVYSRILAAVQRGNEFCIQETFKSSRRLMLSAINDQFK